MKPSISDIIEATGAAEHLAKMNPGFNPPMPLDNAARLAAALKIARNRLSVFAALTKGRPIQSDDIVELSQEALNEMEKQ